MSLFELGGFADEMATDSITIKRVIAAGYDTKGRANPRTFTTFNNVDVCVQAPQGQDLKRLAEGFNASDVRVVISSFALAIFDQLTIQGADYVTEHAEPWASAGGFTRAVVRKFQTGEPRA